MEFFPARKFEAPGWPPPPAGQSGPQYAFAAGLRQIQIGGRRIGSVPGAQAWKSASWKLAPREFRGTGVSLVLPWARRPPKRRTHACPIAAPVATRMVRSGHTELNNRSGGGGTGRNAGTNGTVFWGLVPPTVTVINIR